MFARMVTLCGAGCAPGLWWRGLAGVTDRLLIDLAADGRVSVSPWLEGELP